MLNRQINEQMLTEFKRLETKITSIDAQLASLPKENIYCCRNGKYYKWYIKKGNETIYLPKKEQKLAEQLALRKYLLLLREDLLSEKRAFEFYYKHHKSDFGKAEKVLIDCPEFQSLLSPFFSPVSKELSDWMKSPYEKSKKYPEQLTHKTSSGNFVRSKSEVLIDLLLYKNRIPFRYECELCLNGITIFPDFTIRHPKTGALFYWEHFGLMDDAAYAKSAFSKMSLYTANGIIPSINLITTFETMDHHLSVKMVEMLIRQYFL